MLDLDVTSDNEAAVRLLEAGFVMHGEPRPLRPDSTVETQSMRRLLQERRGAETSGGCFITVRRGVERGDSRSSAVHIGVFLSLDALSSRRIGICRSIPCIQANGGVLGVESRV